MGEPYVPPPPFTPPAQRIPALNDWSQPARPYPGVQYAGTPQYGAPQYGTQPYGTQPYGTPPHAGAPQYGWQPAYPPVPWHPALVRRQPRRPRRSLSIAIVTTAATVAVAIVVALVVSGSRTSSSGGRSLSLPAAVGEYTQLNVLSGTQLATMVGGGLGALTPADLSGAKAAVYGVHDDSEAQLVFLGFDASHSPTIGPQLHNSPAADVTAEALTGSGATAVSSYPAGPLGGSLKAAQVDVSGQDGAVGVWADHDTLGIVVLVEPTGGPAQAASVTLRFRTASEH